MASKPSSSIPSNSRASNDTKHCSNVISKLRRLKIEENLLLQSLQKLDRKRNYEVHESEMSKKMDFNNAMKKLKDSFINVNNLFDEVKTVTRSQELLAELDIDEIKKKVLELETTLRSFKIYLNTEMNSLKLAEQETMKQMAEMNLKESNIFKKRTKISSANYNQIIPSPVRLQMNSPFKCIDVQEFQDFMKNSPNRYGGWNEYHHNIFVKYWQKHFGDSTSTSTAFNGYVAEQLAFENFVEEALFKLQGIQKESLMSHVAWYKNYLFLKDKQQRAIDKWKSNRRSIRKVPEKVMRNSEEEMTTNDQLCKTDHIDNINDNQIASNFIDISRATRTSDNQKTECHKRKEKLMKESKPKRRTNLDQDAIQRHTKPTKQWLSRNYGDGQKIQQVNFIENMEKLRIPSWRQYL